MNKIQHCAFDDCKGALANARGGSLCSHHEIIFGNRCRVRDCLSPRIRDTEACIIHQAMWERHKQTHSRDHLMGVRRMLQRPHELQPWQNQQNLQIHPRRRHDDDDEIPVPPPKHFFSPARSYCVETVVAPCGVVIAWTKFDKSESPTNILRYLETIYPTPESRPAYICIDKACRVLRTSIANGSWEEWKKTTHFIVDSYHYNNHKATDALCAKYCNPAPFDGSAPNLVQFSKDKNGVLQMQRAFNTQVYIVPCFIFITNLSYQVCEQLNGWIGGFESILKRMTPGKFNWFLHSMLFLQTQHVLKKQEEKILEDGESGGEDDVDVDVDVDM